MIIVHAHKEIEYYEVSCDSEEGLASLKLNLIHNEGFTVKVEWLDMFDGKIHHFALFERETLDLLDTDNE